MAAEEAASLDTPCARRSRTLAVGARESLRRGQTREMNWKVGLMSFLVRSSILRLRLAQRLENGSGLARRIFTLQQWSEQPCVRPRCAVLMTAGHNALRGSGPGQKHAFEDAVAQVGCPDRRIDRRCIKCCSPSQPLRHAGLSGVIPFTPRERQVPYSVRSWTSGPRRSWRVCWRARSRRPWWVVGPTIE